MAPTNGQSLVWDNANSKFVPGGGASIITSETPPVSPDAGDMWFNSATLALYLYYADDNSTQWIQINDAGGGNQRLDWVEATTTYDAVAGSRIFADTSSSTVLINLPTSPAMGDEVYVVDASGNSGTYNITVTRGGSNITGIAEDLTIGVNNAAVQLAYYNATRGWIIISK